MIRSYALIVALMLALSGCGMFQDSKKAQLTNLEPESAQTLDHSMDAPPETKGLERIAFDLNRDSQPDIFKYYEGAQKDANNIVSGGVLRRKDIDLNADGSIDVIQLFEDDEVLKQERQDLDFDGKVDAITFFNQGIVLRKEIDLNYDGIVDITRFYTNGKLELIESDRAGDGKVDTWEYYDNGQLDRVGIDRNGDGEVDEWQTKLGGNASATAPAGESAPAQAPAAEGEATTPAASDAGAGDAPTSGGSQPAE